MDFLEGHNYTICIEGKDFVVGQTRQRNVAAAMEHSRRMLCYVTRLSN